MLPEITISESKRIHEKIGFILEGVRKDTMYVDGRYVDSKIYLLTKEDWLKNNKD